MAHQLTAKEAYFACFEDVRSAMRSVDTAVKYGFLRNDGTTREEAFKGEFLYLWQRRIDRGELPPLTPELQKAS